MDYYKEVVFLYFFILIVIWLVYLNFLL